MEQKTDSDDRASAWERARTGREGAGAGSASAVVCKAALWAGNIGSAGEIAMKEPAKVTAVIAMRRRVAGAVNIGALKNGFDGNGCGGAEHLPEEGDTLWIGVKGVGG